MAVLTDIGVRGNENEILQPMLKNRFRVEFVGLADSEPLTLQIITADRPKLSFEEIQLDRYNSRAYIPGKHTFETISLQFESDIGGGVLGALRDQLEHQQKLIGMDRAARLPTARSGRRFKFQTKLLQLDGDSTVFETWFLDGCWIQNIDYGDLDYAASESLKITVTLRFDHARQDIDGDNESAVVGNREPIIPVGA